MARTAEELIDAATVANIMAEEFFIGIPRAQRGAYLIVLNDLFLSIQTLADAAGVDYKTARESIERERDARGIKDPKCKPFHKR